MKVKASWAAFVPISVGAIFLHIYFTFFLGGEEITQQLFGNYSLLINGKTEPEMIVILAAALFVLSFFFSLIDRKTAKTCNIKGDPLGGIFLVLSGLLLGVEGAVGVMNSLTAEASSALLMAKDAFSVVIALLFAIVGMGLLVGFNIAKKIRFFMLLPTIWAAIGMINAFSSHRKEAPSFAFFDIFAWVFLTLFLFNNAMVLCGIEIKNPVKSSFVYGLTYFLFAVVYIITSIQESVNEIGYFDFTQLIPQFVLTALALYALFHLIFLSSKMITKDKAEELSGEISKKEEKKKVKEEKKKAKEKEEEEEDVPEAAFGVGSTKYVTAEFEKIRLEKAAQKAKERTGSIPIVKAESEVEDEQEETMSTLDKIDQLIMELSEDLENK